MPRGRPKGSRSAKNIALVEAAVEILEEIQPATVRAVCYKLFTRGLIESMSKKETNRVSRNLTWARENDEIPWEWIVDETRRTRRALVFDDPAEYVDTMSRAYRKDYWTTQPYRVEVWSEKGTVGGTLQPVINRWGVPFRVMRGYGSTTVLKNIADVSLFDDYDRAFVALYVGDFDASGMHMSEVDIPGRIERYDGVVNLQRIALTRSDCTAELPSFPLDTKKKDPRYRWYRSKYGERCWELDALDPPVLRQRVDDAIAKLVNMETWNHCRMVERAECESIVAVVGQWRNFLRQTSDNSEGPS